MANLTYASPTFEAIAPVHAFNGVPRFGNLDDITQIFSSDGEIIAEKAVSYILGTIFIASFLLTSYIVFLILISIFKCSCKNKFPILAGLPFVEERKYRGIIIRGFLLLGSIITILSGILFLTEGTQSIEAIAANIHDGLDGIVDLSKKVNTTANDFIQLGKESLRLGESIVETVNQGICVVKDNIPGGNPAGDEIQELNDASAELVDILNTLSDLAESEVTTIRDTFAGSVNTIVLNIEDTTDNVADQLNLEYYAGPAIALGAVIMVGLILAWLSIDIKVYFCIQTWFILPLLYIFISVTVVVIAAVGLALVGNSDICIGNPSGSPEGFVEFISEEFFNDDTRAVMDYYIIGGCTGEYSLLQEVKSVLTEAKEATNKSSILSDVLTGIDKTIFEAVCEEGIGPINKLEEALNDTLVVFDGLIEVGFGAIDMLACENINKVWVNVVHNAFCTSAPTALAWMFSTMTAIYVVGIFTFLFRGALLPANLENYREMPGQVIRSRSSDLKEDEDEDEDDDDIGLMKKPAQAGGYSKNIRSSSSDDV